MLVNKIMTPLSVSLRPEQPAAEAWQLIRQHKITGLPVLSPNEEIIGMVTRNDLIEWGAKVFEQNTTVADIMQSPVQTIGENDSWANAWAIHGQAFPVVNQDNRLCGFLAKTRVGCELLNKANSIQLQVDTILDSVNNGIIAIDNNGVIRLYNQAAEKMTRLPKSSAMGCHLSEVISLQGLLDVLKDGRSRKDFKLSMTYTQGNRTYLTNQSPIYENGQVVGAVAIFQDISELEFISEELDSVKQLNKKLELIIESSYDGIIITNADGMIIRANQAHERIIGIPSAKIQGQPMDYLIEKGVYTHSIVEAVLAAGEPVTVVEKDQFLITGSPVQNQEGETERIVINIRDLTELNELREQLRQTKEMSERYQDEINELRGRLLKQEGLVFNSPKMQELLQTAVRLASVDTTVLILGESGVGKDVFAKTIHNNSKRQNGPFITVNCGAIPENLLESEMFGYERGAFTGANREGKAGMFELANNGTLFLDEIGDLPISFQVKLLRAIQEKEVLRVGGSKPKPINVRILAATNRNLETMVKEGQFREDLYFRINVVPLNICPLRERKEDIIPLACTFIQKYEKKYGIRKRVSPRVYDALLNYYWPGNVRELDNMMERLLVTTADDEISVEHLPAHVFENLEDKQPEVYVKGIMPLKNAVLEVERQLISTAIKECGSANRAAQALKVDQSTIVRKISRLKQSGLAL
ncbi:Limonene hydroxylase [Sporotomaculum syntrophicum]|uniref:Limonene hydroxylase n=1 Tax=Sporotomaculum syntrophicum TaxID=182264 RepID=A0A9D3AXW1_9FIRM|nr:sigma 54-interacting transcriptional regulator [Sporotomaculum syntrophicum]KAF1084149.1 Limonene hydroxylase [Sporotomaculum syntrophicum]